MFDGASSLYSWALGCCWLFLLIAGDLLFFSRVHRWKPPCSDCLQLLASLPFEHPGSPDLPQADFLLYTTRYPSTGISLRKTQQSTQHRNFPFSSTKARALSLLQLSPSVNPNVLGLWNSDCHTTHEYKCTLKMAQLKASPYLSTEFVMSEKSLEVRAVRLAGQGNRMNSHPVHRKELPRHFSWPCEHKPTLHPLQQVPGRNEGCKLRGTFWGNSGEINCRVFAFPYFSLFIW